MCDTVFCRCVCAHVKCHVRLLRAFLEGEGGAGGEREWHTFAPQFSRSHIQ